MDFVSGVTHPFKIMKEFPGGSASSCFLKRTSVRRKKNFNGKGQHMKRLGTFLILFWANAALSSIPQILDLNLHLSKRCMSSVRTTLEIYPEALFHIQIEGGASAFARLSEIVKELLDTAEGTLHSPPTCGSAAGRCRPQDFDQVSNRNRKRRGSCCSNSQDI